MARFVALDFETANNSRDSACALAVVRVEDGRVVAERCRLIRPPTATFLFTGIHGITWRHVRDEPTFDGVWPDLAELIHGVDFLVAHNAPFDRGVLRACCERYGFAPPELPWLDTVRAAKKRWGLPRNRLPDVCDHLGIALQHHDPASDARACALIAVAVGEAHYPA